MAVGLQTSIWSNRFKTLYLISLLPIITFLAIFLGFYLSYEKIDEVILNEIFNSSIIIFPIIVIWFFIAVLFQKQIIFSFSGAKSITRQENPEIYNIVENLCISRGLAIPKIGILEDDSMNAFATGWSPKSSWIVFSRGLLNKLEKSEIEAVAGHELTHIMNGDIKIMVLSNVFVGIMGTFSEILIRISKNTRGKNPILIVGISLYLVSLIILPLINLAISRKREFLADAGSVELTKDRESMINALQKISKNSSIESIEKQGIAQMCIITPFQKNHGIFSFFGNLFSTHPSIESRIELLRTY